MRPALDNSSGRWGPEDIGAWVIGLSCRFGKLFTRSAEVVMFSGWSGCESCTVDVVGTTSVGLFLSMAAAAAAALGSVPGALDSTSEPSNFPASEGGSGSSSRFVCLQCGQTHSFDL